MARRRLATGPPDFVGVGAQRAGTTWWFRLLVGHPGIRGPRGRKKELHFFNPFWRREMEEADVDRYHALFPRKPDQLAGEWTPRYMRDAWSPRLIRRAAPEAKILVLLRDPIERYRSGVLHRLTLSPGSHPEQLAVDAIERGRYAVQLRRLRAVFEPERILVLQYERCRQDPVGEYRRTLRFLGAAEDEPPPEPERPRGTTMESKKEPLWPDFTEALRTALTPDIEEVCALVPNLDPSLWPNFAHVAAGRGAQEAV